MTDPRCGTTAGYQAHGRSGEPTCDACRDAAAADRRRRVAYAYLTGGQKMMIDATGTRRRIQALCRIGWPLSTIGERLGVTAQNVYASTVRDKVRRSSAAKIAAIYDELSMLPGPSRSAALRAQAKGWAPPLAYDDDEIDDPAAKPARPPTVIRSRMNRDAEREEKVMELTRAGLSATEIAVRMRTNKRYVQRIRARFRDDEQAAS